MNQLKKYKSKFEMCLAIVVITIVLFPLFNLPRPATLTGHPWKVELLSSLLLLFISLALFINSHRLDFFNNDKKNLLNLVYLFTLFILWSGVSYFWADSPRSVAHHTFLWINYLLIFLFSFYYLEQIKSFKLLGYIFGGASILLLVLILTDYLGVIDFKQSHGKIRVRYAKFAELILTISPVLWGLAFYSKKPIYQNLFLISGTIAWFVTMLSLSKGAFLAGISSFVLLFVCMFFFSKKRFRRKLLAFAGIWLAITVGTQLYFTYISNSNSTVNYISGKTDKDRHSSFMRIFTWKVSLQMINENPIKGVGADNFGLLFNNSRRNFSKANPNDKLNSEAEWYFVERAHNEFIQILAELGIVGFLIFSSIFSLLMFYIFRKIFWQKIKLSPLFWGSFAGMCGFFVSSLFSSFSFRAAQNGIFFFLVLALLVYELTKHEKQQNNSMITPQLEFRKWKIPVLAVLVFLLFLASVYFFTSSLSIYNVYFAENTDNLEESEKLYEKAIFLDSENASAYLSKGGKMYLAKRYKEAIPMFRKAIKKGAETSITYFFLAKSQLKFGKSDSAEQTLSEAVETFSHSVYLRTHYGIVLEQNGKTSQAQKQFDFASKINAKHARSWKIILEKDVLTATLKAEKDSNYTKPYTLSPNSIVTTLFFENQQDGNRLEEKSTK